MKPLETEWQTWLSMRPLVRFLNRFIYKERFRDMSYNYEVGDIVKLKKQHPCGSHEWEILRVGADFRLKCLGCEHQVMLARKLVEKNTRELRKKDLQNF
jgi:hypothetical protein